MSKHKLWSLNKWTWKKIRAEKRRQEAKEAEKLRKKLLRGHSKPKGSAKREVTSLQVKGAFSAVSWKVNTHVMVKGAASPFDGNLSYWVGCNSKLYDGPTAKAIKRPFLETYGPVELHHIDGDHNNWKKTNLESLTPTLLPSASGPPQAY